MSKVYIPRLGSEEKSLECRFGNHTATTNSKQLKKREKNKIS